MAAECIIAAILEPAGIEAHYEGLEQVDATKSIEINLWKKGPSSTKMNEDGNPQEVFRLFPEVLTIKECIDDFSDSVKELKLHVYVTKWQWTNQRLRISSMEVGDIVTVEDYQMNMSVGLSEAPTTSVFGANQLTFTLYPIIVYYREPAQSDGNVGDIKKAAIAFVSDDRQHGWEQIEDFDKRSRRA